MFEVFCALRQRCLEIAAGYRDGIVTALLVVVEIDGKIAQAA
jgi:hypothetical protein